MKKVSIVLVVYWMIVGAILTGWIKSIVKAAQCNWEPIGKAEVVYTIGACTVIGGAVIGWIDIEDK